MQGNVLEKLLCLEDGGASIVLTDSSELGYLAVNPVSYDLGQAT